MAEASVRLEDGQEALQLGWHALNHEMLLARVTRMW